MRVMNATPPVDRVTHTSPDVEQQRLTFTSFAAGKRPVTLSNQRRPFSIADTDSVQFSIPNRPKKVREC
jgi:hypothetical protein